MILNIPLRTIHRTIVSALVLSQDGKLLMGMKDQSKGGVYADCWHIPGGGVDEGEDEKTALRRELLEEIGLDVIDQNVQLADATGSGQSEKTLGDGEKVLCQMSFHVYRVDLKQLADDVQIRLNDDLVKFEWVDVSDLGKYKLTPPSQKLFSTLGWI